MSEILSSSFIVKHRPDQAIGDAPDLSAGVTVLPDGRRIQVTDREVLEKAIQAAMTEYAA